MASPRATLPAGDAEIRQAMRAAFANTGCRSGGGFLDDLVLAEEVPMFGGHVRADFVGVSPTALHVYEIKSDRDGRERLAEQARVYNEVADAVTLLVGPRHLAWAVSTVPDWWEIRLVTRDRSGSLRFDVVAPRGRNPRSTRLAQLTLLPKDVLRAVLATDGIMIPSRVSMASVRETAISCAPARSVRQAVGAYLSRRVISRPSAMLQPGAALQLSLVGAASF